MTRRSSGLVLFGAMMAFIWLGPFLWTISPTDQNLMAIVQPPSLLHPLGADQYGRDMLARLMDGGRVSVLSALAIVAGSLAIGIPVGVLAAGRSWLAYGLTQLVDTTLALPSMIIALAIVGALGAGIVNLILAFTAVGWPWYARLARGIAVERLTGADILAARLAGVSRLSIILGHVLPHLAQRLATAAALDLGYTLGALAGFSYLGLGAQAPAAEWGMMLRDAQMFFTVAPWLLAGPCVAIGLVVSVALLLSSDAKLQERRT